MPPDPCTIVMLLHVGHRSHHVMALAAGVLYQDQVLLCGGAMGPDAAAGSAGVAACPGDLADSGLLPGAQS